LKVAKDDNGTLSKAKTELRSIANNYDLLFDFENREYLISRLEQKEKENQKTIKNEVQKQIDDLWAM
jgi:hypothetical protein